MCRCFFADVSRFFPILANFSQGNAGFFDRTTAGEFTLNKPYGCIVQQEVAHV